MKIATFLVLLVIMAMPVQASTDCLECHGKNPPKGMSGAGSFDTGLFDSSVHSGLACNDCHNIDPTKKHKGELEVNCSSCHQQEQADLNKSPHAISDSLSQTTLPDCVTCHSGHNVLPVTDPKAPSYHLNSVKICVKCHEDRTITDRVEHMPQPEMIISYENSVHGRALAAGNNDAPACIDCHGGHTTMPSDDPDSPVYKTHIAATCGSCHEEIAREYAGSIHGKTLEEGVLESPTCTNCHGEHDILPSADPISSVYPLNIRQTCSECHASEVIVGKFGLKADRINTFKESFHGVALELEETRAANCASCHGVHNIYPQSDKRSLIHPDNIGSMCGSCHEDLPEDFAQGTFHKSSSDPESGGAFFVREFYWWFIGLIILAFVIYRVLEYKRRVKITE
ncbi:MAG: cytochrome c3 family protein [bacterium]|nr:cytochrome c3 family protein [bacterium]